MPYTRRIIVIQAKHQELVNGWIEEEHGPGGEITFTVPLWSQDLNPAVDPPDQFWCNWNLTDSLWDSIQDRFPQTATWKVNTGEEDTDLAHYRTVNWDNQQVLDDTTRKGKAHKVAQPDPRISTKPMPRSSPRSTPGSHPL